MPSRSYISAANSNTDLSIPGYPGLIGAVAQAGGTTTKIVFPVTASATDNYYVGAVIEITAGSGVGEICEVTAYDGTTQTATVAKELTTATDATTIFTVYGLSGICQGGSINTITLDSGESSTDGIFVGAHIRIQNGVCKGQHRLITAYSGASRVATIDGVWEHMPSSGDVYCIYGEGGLLEDAAAGTVTLPATAKGATEDDYYNDLLIEVTAAGDDAAVGQSRRITDYDGTTRVATLDSDWATTPTGTATYRIFGGWAGTYEDVSDYSMVNIHLVAATAENGLHEIAFSQTSSGYNGSGNEVRHVHVSSWGERPNGLALGDIESSHSIMAKYSRVVVIISGHALTGGIQVRFSMEQNSLRTTSIENSPKPGAICDLTRSIIAARVERSSLFANLHTNTRGELAIDIPRTAFDDLRVAELSPQIQMSFVSEVGDQELVPSLAGDQSTIRYEVSQYYLRIGDSPVTPTVASGDSAVLRTKQICRYRAGLGSVARFTCVFDGVTDNCVWQGIGLATAGSSLEFGYHSDGIPALDAVKFGVNRGTGGRSEMRALSVSAAAGTDTIQLTLPNFPTPGGSTTYDVSITAGDSAEEVARKIVETAVDTSDATKSWADYAWDVQNVGKLVIFRGVGAGPRDNTAYAFSAATTGITNDEIQQLLIGASNELAEIRELVVNTPATADGNITISLNGGLGNNIALTSATHDTAEKVAWAVVNSPATAWADYGSGWRAEIISAQKTRVRFTALTVGIRAGTYTFTDTGGTGVTLDTFQQRAAGQAKTENWTFQENWNLDRCDGTGPSGFILNPQRGNVYAITYQYLGFGGITYMIENPATTRFIPVHVEEFAGTSAVTHLENPHMTLQAYIHSISGSVEQRTHALSMASWAYFTEGPVRHIAPRFAVISPALTLSTALETPLIFFKHPEVFNDAPSQIGIFMRSLLYGIEAGGARVSSVYVRLNPVISVAAPAWEYHKYPETPMLVATQTTAGQDFAAAAMRVAGGTLISGGSTSGDASIQIPFNDFELGRGDVLCVSVRPGAGASPDAQATVSWIEDH